MASTYKVLGQVVPTTSAVTFTDTGDLVTKTAHGLSNGTMVSFTTIISTSGIFPNTPYFVINVTTDTFQVSNTLGGSALPLTTNGSGTMVTFNDLYTVPSSTSTVISTLLVCNQGVTTNYSIAIRPAGATLESKHYILYNSVLSFSDTGFFTLGLTLSQGDIVSIFSGTNTVSFQLYGTEMV